MEATTPELLFTAKTGAKVGGKLNFLNKNIQTDSFDRYKRI